MRLFLITQPSLLRTRFGYTRQRLLGTWQSSTRIISSTPEVAVTRISSTLPEIEEVVPMAKFPQLPVAPTTKDLVIQGSETPNYSKTPELVPMRPVQAKNVTVETRQNTWWKSASRFVLTVVMIVAIGLASVIILPELYFSVFSSNSAVQDIASEALNTSQTQESKPVAEQQYMPEKDESLPEGSWLRIPSIGVDSEMRPTANPDEALDQGVWMVPDFGRPGDYSQPTILAAHRFGWDWWWQSDFWKLNSFYLLPDTQVGDRFEVIYDQRKWVYEIYAAEEGQLISDYDADMILYTCKYLNSPQRFFRYAKVVKE